MSKSVNIPKWAQEFEVAPLIEADENLNPEFANLLSQASDKAFVEGEVYKGNVISVGNDYIMIDIGYKQEGLVSTKEFKGFDGQVKIKAGDQIDVYLEKLESTMGNLVLSKDKAEIIRAWDKISEACDKGEPVEGTVLAKVKGGLAVDIGVKAFLPGSQIDIRPTKNLDKFLGKTMEFKVIKFNKKRGNIVLSRRAILADERGKLREETLDAIQEGMVVKGIVKNVTDYGAFIDLGGVDGLLHITDMSWGRIKHPNVLINVGDEINVKVLKYDSDKERVSLGMKQILPNPWDLAPDKYLPGLKVTGEVVSVKDYGVFVELNDGIEGLIHVSEMSWTQKNSPAQLYSVGDKIEAQVLEVDTENKRISLGVKQLKPNPWNEIAEKYKVGQQVKGKVKSVVDFGIFVDLGEEFDALIHVSDLSWTKKNVNPSEEYKVGNEVNAIVLTVDSENQKFSLGIKQLEEDPWKKIEERFPAGTIVEGEIIRVTDFGGFMELETGIEGLIHISEISEDRIERASDKIKKGDKVKVRVISIDKNAKKIALSIKAVGSAELAANMSSYQDEAAKNSNSLASQLKGIKID